MRINLSVPYSEKDAAKAMGAKWDPVDRVWYVSGADHPAVRRWPPPPSVLPDEDRSFGGSMLFVDLIPQSCWFTNARSALSHAEWQQVRLLVGGRARWHCEICGSEGNHIHERWHYDQTNLRQSLRRLVCLCADCHLSTHFGFANVSGKTDEALEHLCRVNNWSVDQARTHVDEAFDVWLSRNRFHWELDLTILTNAGFHPTPPVAKDARERIATNRLIPAR